MEGILTWIIAILGSVIVGLALRALGNRKAANAKARAFHRERFCAHAQKAIETGNLSDRDLERLRLYMQLIDTREGRDLFASVVKQVLEEVRDGVVARPSQHCQDWGLTMYHLVRNLCHVGLLRGLILERRLIEFLDHDKEPEEMQDHLTRAVSQQHLRAI